MNNNDITNWFENLIRSFLEALPEILGALLLVVVGYLVALLIKSVIAKLLRQVRFDRALHSSPAGNSIARLVDSPSRFVGKIAFWLVFLGFVSMAVAVLDVPALNNFMAAIYGYLPHVIAAIIIFLVASALSVGAVAFVRRVMGRTTLAKIVSSVVPSLVMSIAVFMILDELMIAENIVTITYTALIGAVALGLALAFGLGGRDVAARLLEQAYEAGAQNAEGAKQEAKRASRNAKREAQSIQNNQ
ncbi:transporter [Candidatus Saccharibacteria bacterium]|nr:transporter [Candidatus Saccharibacteria bacterium]